MNTLDRWALTLAMLTALAFAVAIALLMFGILDAGKGF